MTFKKGVLQNNLKPASLVTKPPQVKLEQLNLEKSELVKEHDYTNYLLKELEEVQLDGSLTELEEEHEKLSNVEEIIGLPIQGNELFYESISPRYFVNDSTVPTISFYGGEDLFTPEEQGQVLRDELNNFNRINEYIIYPDGGHGWGESDTFDTLDRVIEFIDEHIL